MAPAECVVVSMLVQMDDSTGPPGAVGGSGAGKWSAPVTGGCGGSVVLQLSSPGWRLAGSGVEAPLTGPSMRPQEPSLGRISESRG